MIAAKSFKKKKVSKSLIRKLDEIFSTYVRIRDANDQGICRCITSGEFIHWKDCDAGHFITRDNLATRWDERNVNAQGRGDNRFKSGKQYEHGLAIDRKHGEGTAEKLLIKSKGVYKPMPFEIEEMISHYKKEVSRLKLEKGL